jgi:hypothetical protein
MVLAGVVVLPGLLSVVLRLGLAVPFVRMPARRFTTIHGSLGWRDSLGRLAGCRVRAGAWRRQWIPEQTRRDRWRQSRSLGPDVSYPLAGQERGQANGRQSQLDGGKAQAPQGEH